MSSGCGDVLSLEDLKTAKKHQTFEAEVITGKAGGVAGGADINEATNAVTGQVQKTLPAILSDSEEDFHDQLTDQEAGFQQFLLNSGYQFLGDYEDGPFQFSARNQYIRYDDQYYRLNAATGVGFTTTGTDATSFANDVAHFVLMDGDTLRQQLSSSDGLKLVGKCATISELRTIEPSYAGQSIILRRAATDGPLINGILSYDADDTSTEDDGYSVFVTTDGARWKANVRNGYDLALTGYIPGTDDFSTYLQKIVDGIVDAIVTSGGYSNQQTEIVIYAPSEYSEETYHSVGSTIYIPTFISLKFVGGTHYLKTTGDFAAIVWGNNYFVTNHGLTWSMVVSGFSDTSKLRTNAFKRRLISTDSQVVIKGVGKVASTTYGVLLGETASVTGAVPTSDVILSHVHICCFAYSLQLGTVNTYNLYIDNVYLDGIDCALYIPNGSSTNSGETIHVSNSTLTAGSSSSNGSGNGVYSDSLAYNITFTNCHLDYNVDAVLKLGPHATYSNFTFRNCWIEGFNTLVDCDSMYVGDLPTVNILGCLVDVRSADGTTWGGPRQILSSGSSYALFIDEATELKFYKKPGANCLTVALCGADSLAGSVIKHPSYSFSNTNSRRKRPYPLSINSSLRGLALFSGNEGGSAIGASDTSQLMTSVSGSPMVVYGGATDVNSTFQSIVIEMSADSDIVYIYPKHKVFLQRADVVAASCSIKLEDVSSGAVTVSAALLNYYNNTISGTVSNSTVTISQTASLNSTVQGGVTEDVSAYLNVTGTTLTTDDFVGVEPVWVTQNYTGFASGSNLLVNGYSHSLPALKLTGFVGTIRLALPFWWKL